MSDKRLKLQYLCGDPEFITQFYVDFDISCKPKGLVSAALIINGIVQPPVRMIVGKDARYFLLTADVKDEDIIEAQVLVEGLRCAGRKGGYRITYHRKSYGYRNQGE